MEYLIIFILCVLAIATVIAFTIRILVLEYTQEKIAKFIAEDLYKLEKENPLKHGYDYKYKIRNWVLITKFWQNRGKNAGEIYKTTKHEL